MSHKIVLKSLVLVITDYYMYAHIIVCNIVIIRTLQFFSLEECANIELYQIIIYMLYISCIVSGVSRISFRGGGVQNFSGKVGVFAWREAPCSAWRSHVFVRGVRGHAPPRKF